MDIEAEEKDGRMILDFNQNHTLGNLIRKAVWEVGGEAAYDKGHPLGEESRLIVKGDDPKDTLEEAADRAEEWMEDLEGQLA